MWKDFKAFLLRGNVIDLAVAVVIGAAFGKIVTSIVDDIIMPCIGMLTAGVDFTNMKYVLKAGEVVDGELTGEVAIKYGSLINTIIQFVIIAFVIFIVVRAINKAKEKLEALAKKNKEEEEKKEEETPKDIELLTEIRDLLKKAE